VRCIKESTRLVYFSLFSNNGFHLFTLVAFYLISRKARNLPQTTTLYSTHVTLSKTLGTFSNKYSTIPSGPLSTCRPCGIACVLIPGLSFSAISLISWACSGVHIEAEKRMSGWRSRTVGDTCSIAGQSVSDWNGRREKDHVYWKSFRRRFRMEVIAGSS
jgi:hypothetical protein